MFHHWKQRIYNFHCILLTEHNLFLKNGNRLINEKEHKSHKNEIL